MPDLRVVCSGHLVRYPLGGHSWHHLQYLLGLEALGHDVTFFEHYGWNDSCYDPAENVMTDDPTYGVTYVKDLFERFGFDGDWCYLAADGSQVGMTRDRLAQRLREADVYLNLSNINWIPELELCRRRVLVDTDPVFTQIGGFGLGGPFSRYHARFTYGENVHRSSGMPTGGVQWLPTRQPVVLDCWPYADGDPGAPVTTVMNWSNFGAREHDGVQYGQKDEEFPPFFDLPRQMALDMEIAVNGPEPVRRSLQEGGWKVADPLEVTRTPQRYQRFLRDSSAEFAVAKHAYVSTRSGWFSDRSAGYLASGRPVIVQDTGFSDFLPVGEGLLAWRTPEDARSRLSAAIADYDRHSVAAREVVKEHFEASNVLTELLETSL